MLKKEVIISFNDGEPDATYGEVTETQIESGFLFLFHTGFAVNAIPVTRIKQFYVKVIPYTYVDGMKAQDCKINAIKWLRGETGWTLKDSLDFYEKNLDGYH